MMNFYIIGLILLISQGSAVPNISDFDENITVINLIDLSIPKIFRDSFHKYSNLKELSIVASKINEIADGAFFNLAKLEKLNLGRNGIKQMSCGMFSPKNNLRELLLFENLIANFSLDIDCTPNLIFLDISNNKINTVPLKILGRANLTLHLENNPLNCSIPELNQTAACNNLEYLPQCLPMRKNAVAGFVDCIFWIIGAFWIGVIIGSACKIRSILCPKVIKKLDQMTQYDPPLFGAVEEMKKQQSYAISAQGV